MSTSGEIIFNELSGKPNTGSRPPPAGPVQEGRDEAVKDLVRESEKNKQKLDELVEKSGRALFKASTVFPFELFPTTLIIDENKVTIFYREFFWSERIHSIMIRDIKDVIVETSLFFATLIIIDDAFKDDPVRIHYLWKKQAMHARKLVQGLIVSIKGVISPMVGGVEFTNISPKDLMVKLEHLGEVFH